MRKILLVAVAVVATLAMTAVSASAEYSQRGSFAGGGPNPGGSGTAAGELMDPGAADVRGSTGRLYVADTGNDRVQLFTPTASGGTYDSQVSIAAPTGIAVDQDSGDVYVSNASGVRKFDEDLQPVGGWPAPTETGSLAVDPVSHDLLVADQDDNLIRRYDSDGTPGATFAADRPLDVAVDATGDVIVVTSTGDIINDCSQTSAVERFTAAGVSEGSIGSLDAPGAVSVDPDDDAVVVAAQVNQYNCDTGLYPIVAFFAVDGTAEPSLQLDSDTHWAVVSGLTAAGGGSSRVYAVTKSPFGDVFGATQIGVLENLTPDVSLDLVDTASVTATTATLNGSVDPNGEATRLHVDYRRNGEADWTSASPQDAGSGSDPAATGPIQLTDLEPNSDYEVRLVAGNQYGDTISTVRTFTTDVAPPAVRTGQALGVTATGARLNGQVDPHGQLTTYWVEYGPTSTYGSRLPAGADVAIGGGYGNVSVGQVVTGLAPQTTYHYRIVAQNPEGTTEGADSTFVTSQTSNPVTDGCPNAGVRAELGAALLPDCRAYEMVSLPGKNGSDVLVRSSTIRAATDGGIAAFSSSGAFAGSPGSPTSVQYMASRDEGGWKTDPITPRQPPNAPNYPFNNTSYRGYTDDLHRGFLSVYPDLPLVADAPVGVPNLYARSLPAGSYSLLSALAPGVPALAPNAFGGSAFAAASADGTHVLFESVNNLTPDAAGFTQKLYESVDGQIRLAGILPAGEGGAPAPGGSIAGLGSTAATYTDRTISRDGSRVFFTANPDADGLGQIYVREDGVTKARVSAPEPDAPSETTQPAHFWTATPDGRYVFFTSTQKLTADATAVAGSTERPDLYRYDVQSADLIDVTASETGTPAAVGGGGTNTGGVVGISDDGTHAYFVASGQIVSGAPGNSKLKLYRWQEGQGISYVVSLSSADFPDWYQGGVLFDNTKESRVSTSGRRVLFVSQQKLDPDRDNAGHRAAYLYDADDGTVDCISCPGDGSPAAADASVGRAATITGSFSQTTAAEGYAKNPYLPRYLSDDGRRAFFMTADSLLARDSNGKEDVYMAQDGHVSLISTGKSADRSFFGDASPSGDDVLFATRERLVAKDIDNNLDVYDARVGGGLPEPAPPAKPCVNDACQGVPSSPPALPDAGSVAFGGDGNVQPAREPGRSPASVTIAKLRAVVGTAASLRVKVSSAGTIRASGALVRAVKRTTSKPATYRVNVVLTAKAKTTLKTKKTLKARIKIAFTPKSGRTATKTLTVTFKQPRPPAKPQRRASGGQR